MNPPLPYGIGQATVDAILCLMSVALGHFSVRDLNLTLDLKETSSAVCLTYYIEPSAAGQTNKIVL